MLKVFEGFAGIGSQRMALRNIGVDFEVVGISEVDKWALLAYDAIHNEQKDIKIPSKDEMLKEFENKHIAYNFSTNKLEIPKTDEDIIKLYKAHIRSKNYGDIRLINPKELPEIDLFTYSYPCKNISLLGGLGGLEEGSNTQSSLVWEIFKIIENCKPKYLLMENVKNLVGKKFKPSFDLICDKLDKLGYNNYWKVLNGKDFGVAQNRERVIMVSIRKDIDIDKSFKFSDKFPLEKTLKDYLEDSVDKKYYLPIEKVNAISHWKAFQKPFKRILGNNSICPTITARGAGEEHSGMIILSESINETQDLHNVAQNILINNDDYYKYNFRKLTPLESWRLMGFTDDDFYKAKEIGGLNDTKLYERAGRGIVVPMLEEIFKNLFKD